MRSAKYLCDVAITRPFNPNNSACAPYADYAASGGVDRLLVDVVVALTERRRRNLGHFRHDEAVLTGGT
jgi:hypothetical protein